jgi:hypothetical protein
MKRVFAMILGLAILMPVSAAMTDSSLDNSAWKAMEKGKKGHEDHLLFMNGQFVSSGCVPYGFTTASYTTAPEDGQMKWSATVTNADNEKMVWTGKTAGDKMTGQYVYTDKKGKSWTQEWSAQKMAKE